MSGRWLAIDSLHACSVRQLAPQRARGWRCRWRCFAMVASLGAGRCRGRRHGRRPAGHRPRQRLQGRDRRRRRRRQRRPHAPDPLRLQPQHRRTPACAGPAGEAADRAAGGWCPPTSPARSAAPTYAYQVSAVGTTAASTNCVSPVADGQPPDRASTAGVRIVGLHRRSNVDATARRRRPDRRGRRTRRDRGLIGRDRITLSGNADIRVGVGTNGNLVTSGNASDLRQHPRRRRQEMEQIRQHLAVQRLQGHRRQRRPAAGQQLHADQHRDHQLEQPARDCTSDQRPGRLPEGQPTPATWKIEADRSTASTRGRSASAATRP